MACQRLPDALGAKRPAPQGDDLLPGSAFEQLEHQGLLARPERRLALAVEERGDRLPQLAREQRVGVQRPAAERSGGLPGGGRLAGAHEADEHEGAPRARHGPARQSMRSA